MSCPLFSLGSRIRDPISRGRTSERQVEKLSQLMEQFLWGTGKLLKREVCECQSSWKKSVMLNEYAM